MHHQFNTTMNLQINISIQHIYTKIYKISKYYAAGERLQSLTK